MDVRADFLVIGSGVAGLRAALSLADAGDVVILSLRRTARRGAHFRTDFPTRDDLHWKKRVADVLRT